VASRQHQEKILAYVRSGETEGARIAYQSTAPGPHANGFYVPPVIFDDVSVTNKIAREEIFGPVLSVMGFRDEEEAIRIANDTIYGLPAIVWTRSLRRAHRMSQGIKAGWIVVNATDKPTSDAGGAMMTIGGHKESGLGAEGGIAGLVEYTTSTAVQIFV